MNRWLALALGLIVIAVVLLAAGATGWLNQAQAQVTPLERSQTHAGPAYALPALDLTESWESTVYVQNAGTAPVYAVLELYGSSEGECTASSPLTTLCSGLITPGRTWSWTHDALPATARSGLVRAWTACPAQGGIPTNHPLAVVVDRAWMGGLGALPVAGAYSAMTGGAPDPMTGAYHYFVPRAASIPQEEHTTLILQNLGTACATVEVSYWEQAACLQPATSFTVNVPPGQAARLPVAGQPEEAFTGAAWIESSQPLGVLADHWEAGGSRLLIYSGLQTATSGRWVAPVVYAGREGWSTELLLQNPSLTASTTTYATFYDQSGESVTTAFCTLCPGDSTSVRTDHLANLPPGFLGSAQVQGSPAVAVLRGSGGDQGAAYALLPGSAHFGTSVVAMPWLARQPGCSSRIAIVNLNPNPGRTDFLLELYGPDGGADTVHEALEAGHAEYVDLANWAYLPLRWVGSGLVRVLESTQSGGPTLAIVVLQQDRGQAGDASRAYEGLTVPQELPPGVATPATTNTPLPPVSVRNLHMSNAPGGSPVTLFPAGTTQVYAIFDYRYAQGDELSVQIRDEAGNLIFSQVKNYEGAGTESLSVTGQDAFQGYWEGAKRHADNMLAVLGAALEATELSLLREMMGVALSEGYQLRSYLAQLGRFPMPISAQEELAGARAVLDQALQAGQAALDPALTLEQTRQQVVQMREHVNETLSRLAEARRLAGDGAGLAFLLSQPNGYLTTLYVNGLQAASVEWTVGPADTPTPVLTPTRTATATPGPPTLTPGPGTPSVTPTRTPFFWRTPTPAATFTPTATPTPVRYEVELIPAADAVGYVVSSDRSTNHFGEGHVFVGADTRPATPIVYYGALQFELTSLPSGAQILSAQVEIVGLDDRYLEGSGGVWKMRLLDSSVDLNWRNLGYWHIHTAPVLGTLTPTLSDRDLAPGRLNVFSLTQSQYALLRERLSTTGRVSFRLDGGPGRPRVRHIFDWDPGYRVPAGTPPVLRIVYILP